MTFFTFKPIS